MLIANADAIRTRLNWNPRLDDLDTIARTSLAWEKPCPEKENHDRRYP